MRDKTLRLPFSLLLLCLPSLALGQAVDPNEVPKELQPFTAKNESVLAYEYADLNGDGTRDVVFIVEPKFAENDPRAREDEGVRTLKIAIRARGGELKVVKENRKVAFCRSCGGTYGDPFEGLSAGGKGFSVSHYGGASWRWLNTFSFAYSRRDNTWQLVEVEESGFDVSDPDAMETKTYKPPRHFGKIDIADFDPRKYRGVGKK